MRRFAIPIVALMLIALSGVAPAGAVGPTVFINEIHYDNTGTDTGEAVEIAGPAGTDLTGWSIVLYNGSGGAPYDTIALSGTIADQQAGFGTLSFPRAGIQNGSPDGLALVNASSAVVQFLSYEGAFTAVGGPANGMSSTDIGVSEGSGTAVGDSLQLAGTGTEGGDFTWSAPQPNTFGAVNTGQTFGIVPTDPRGDCGDAATLIHDIQGSGLASTDVGSIREIEGVVVGDFQGSSALGGFFIQEEDADADADPLTSEGIFVFDGGFGVDVTAGDVVRVRGRVAEFFALTEINNVQAVLDCGTTGTVSASTVTLPVTSTDDFEAYEGMAVTFPQDLYISEYFNFDRFGELVLTSERQFQPTAIADPGSPVAIQTAIDNALGRITLDDGRGGQNPDPAIHPNGGVFDLTNLFRGGDIVTNVTGVMDYSFGLYRIQPTQGADYTAANPRTAAPDEVGGGLRVASFNVLNYFTTIDTGAPICGPAQNQDCRGADNANEFTRQRDKIIAAIAAIDADVVGVIEIENHPADPVDVPMQNLVDGLNALVGAGTYDFIDTGPIGSDAIKVGLLYRRAGVTPVGDYALLDSSVDPRFDDSRNRPALAQTFMDDTTGGVFTVVNNHLKSKGSGCGPGDDDPVQGNCNLTRTLAAQALVDWLATDPTGSGDEDFLIVGDLNAYDHEDPIKAIAAGSDDALGTDDDFGDLLLGFEGEYAYSYVFDGQLGYLDHALANSALLDEVTGATVWHINADEPDIIDYDTTFKKPAQDALYAPDPYRSSDHDPVIVGLDVCDEIAPTIDVSVTPDMLWPPNHKYRNVTATVTVSDNFDPSPTVTLVSVVSNEPDNGPDDGNTINDIVVVDDVSFRLRAERSGIGQGRVYTITYQVTDACGNSTIASVTVTVPLDLTG